MLHDHEVTYAVVAPVGAFGGLRRAYVEINRGLVAALRSLGVSATLAEGGPALSPAAGPCFDAPAPGEVTAGGRKLVGSAQVRLGRAFLQHGSVLVSGDQSELLRMAAEARRPDPPATLLGCLGAVPSHDEVADAIVGGCRASWEGSWKGGGYSQAESEAAERLERERYGATEWTWRR